MAYNELAIGAIIAVIIFSLLALGILVLTGIFWLWMLIDCLRRENNKFPNKNANDKIFWALIIFFTYLIGAILYFIIVKKKTK